MNKLIKLSLAFLLAFTLAGCSSNKHKDLLEMLDNGEYTKAVEYINNLAYEAKKDELNKIDFADMLEGSWEVTSNDRANLPVVTFDGNKINIGDKTYLWEESYREENYITLKVLDGATEIGSFTLRLDEQSSSLNVDIDGQYTSYSYVNMSKYEEITITKDNFSTYFEEVTYDTWGKDSFDDTTSLSIHKQLRLKDEYYHNDIGRLSSLAIEVEYNYVRKNVDVDYTAETYTIKDTVANSEDSSSKKGSFGIDSHSFDKSVYKYDLNTTSISKDSSSQVLWNYMTEWSISRIEGTICIPK